MKKDEEWKEFWRNNNELYQENKRQQRDRIIIFAFLAVVCCIITCYCVIAKPNWGNAQSEDTYEEDSSISFDDHLFITTIDEISDLYEQEILNDRLIDKAITKLDVLYVSEIFVDLYYDTMDVLDMINPIYNDYDDETNRADYDEFADAFYDRFDAIMKENGKMYDDVGDAYEYYYEIEY
ncbi:hypothetical protein [Anaerosporobacter sp.]|uniref:hypothetical protein n=1 Tax=Anaerosporobacter sp. TaxID=1872529 RepID=UPI00286F5105|nr:hypothetical protein [Anaerosporobacter sp.]